jgi:hypothetical protein
MPIWINDLQLKAKAPAILCEYLLKKIKWPSE